MSTTMSDDDSQQAPILAHFARAARRIDTQGAVVFLNGEEAIKIRRAVRLPFLDYSTLDKRRAAAEAEIALNRPHAPHIYRDAAPIHRAGEGFSFDGDGEIVEWATRMRRFDEEATLDKLAARGQLRIESIRELAAAIHAMHEQAPICQAEPAIAAMGHWIAQNEAAFAAEPELFPKAAAAGLAARTREAFARASPMLRARGGAERIRRCHGDLHLGNIALIDGKATPFDAIEFDASIATGDILYDLAFTVMDLWERDLSGHANLLLNAYLSLGDAENYAALALLPLFLSLRAAIRAKVEANSARRLEEPARTRAKNSARRYFDFAARFLDAAPPRLVAVGGLSGTGKSALCAALAPALGAAPGAVWLRSDVERKRLFGVDEQTRLPDAAYAAGVGQEIYARLIDKARRALTAGAATLIDATHAHAHERVAAAALGAELGVPFVGLWLDAPLPHRLQRVAARRGDASDADEQVARRQRAEPLREPGWRVVDASGPLAVTLANARIAQGDGVGV